MIYGGLFLMIIGIASIFIGIKKENVMLKNIAIGIMILSFLMMIVPLVLLRNF